MFPNAKQLFVSIFHLGLDVTDITITNGYHEPKVTCHF